MVLERSIRITLILVAVLAILSVIGFAVYVAYVMRLWNQASV